MISFLVDTPMRRPRERLKKFSANRDKKSLKKSIKNISKGRLKRMQITLLKHVGAYGIITGYKSLMPDILKFEIGEKGTLFIGAKSYATDGTLEICAYEIKHGPNKVMFVDESGYAYACGTITKNSRFMSVTNPIDELTVRIALAYNEQGEKIKQLEAALAEIKNKFGISII